MVAADDGRAWDAGWVCGRGSEDGDSGEGDGEDQLPAGYRIAFNGEPAGRALNEQSQRLGLSNRTNSTLHAQRAISGIVKPPAIAPPGEALGRDARCRDLPQERTYFVRQVSRNLIACLQFLSDRGAHRAPRRHFRVTHVIRLVA